MLALGLTSCGTGSCNSCIGHFGVTQRSAVNDTVAFAACTATLIHNVTICRTSCTHRLLCTQISLVNLVHGANLADNGICQHCKRYKVLFCIADDSLIGRIHRICSMVTIYLSLRIIGRLHFSVQHATIYVQCCVRRCGAGIHANNAGIFSVLRTHGTTIQVNNRRPQRIDISANSLILRNTAINLSAIDVDCSSGSLNITGLVIVVGCLIGRNTVANHCARIQIDGAGTNSQDVAAAGRLTTLNNGIVHLKARRYTSNINITATTCAAPIVGIIIRIVWVEDIHGFAIFIFYGIARCILLSNLMRYGIGRRIVRNTARNRTAVNIHGGCRVTHDVTAVRRSNTILHYSTGIDCQLTAGNINITATIMVCAISP